MDGPSNNDEIFSLLMKKDEITWKAMIQELVRSDHMDPWDIDVSLLAKRFIEVLQKLQDIDVHISGKMVLAAALLLKIKSTRLVGEDISRLDQLFASSEQEVYEDMWGFGDDFDDHYVGKSKLPTYGLTPRTPQPRQRKVSIYDLMEALQQAMEVKRRRVARNVPVHIDIHIPKKTVDISQVIREVYTRIKIHFGSKQELFFSDLTGLNPTKDDMVYTFIPLLHLTNERKIDLEQEKTFGPIQIVRNPVTKVK